VAAALYDSDDGIFAVAVSYKKEHPDKRGETYEDDDKLVCTFVLADDDSTVDTQVVQEAGSLCHQCVWQLIG